MSRMRAAPVAAARFVSRQWIEGRRMLRVRRPF
jgi:hypothetical protein